MSEEVKPIGEIAQSLEQDYRSIALNLKTKLKEWFTQGQVISIYGKEEAPQIIQTLEFMGLLKSETMHGAWKHRIIETPQEREIFLRSNLAALAVQKSDVERNIVILEHILETVVKDA